MLIPTELINVTVNYFDEKKAVHYSRVFAISKFVVTWTQCTLGEFRPNFLENLLYFIARKFTHRLSCFINQQVVQSSTTARLCDFIGNYCEENNPVNGV